jgi:hypothetical protein
MKRKQRQTFYDVIEKNIDPDQPRARELRIQAFGQAQNYLEDLIDSAHSPDEVYSMKEHLDELINETNGESGAFVENFSNDVDRIIELGIKALKAELEKEIGAFEFEQRETKKEDE